MNERLESFMREGLQTYPKAFSTVRLFQAELERRLRELLESKDDWTSFEFPEDGKTIKTESDARDSLGAWVCAIATGVLVKKHDARIDVGVWWSPPTIKVPVIVYASVYGRPEDLVRFKATSSSPRVKIGVVGSGTRVYVEPSPAFDVTADVNLVLDELQRHAAAWFGSAKPTE